MASAILPQKSPVSYLWLTGLFCVLGYNLFYDASPPTLLKSMSHRPCNERDTSNLRTSGIYRIYSEINRRSYVGSAVNFSKRWGTHIAELRRNKHPNQHLQRAWNKYGPDAFEFSVLERCPIDMLIEREQYHLDQYPDRYNIAPIAGSQLGYRHTPEAREKMRASIKRRELSDEQRANLSRAAKERNASPEIREKIRQAATGRKHTPETRAKISEANRRRVVTDEYREKMSASLKAYWERRRLENSRG